MIYLKLFWIFFRISVISFGGVFGVLPELQRIIVQENLWLTNDQFIQSYVVGQFVPGPNMSMCPLIGYRIAGGLGALAAFLGIYAAPTAIMALGYGIYGRHRHKDWVQRAEIALRPLVFALISSTALTFFQEQAGKKWPAALLVGTPFLILHASRRLGALSCILLTGGLWWVAVFLFR